jgi:hypothetical protein
MKALKNGKLWIAVALVWTAALGSGGLNSGPLLAAENERSKGNERKGPLAKLPSKPGAHIEKIKAMGADTWLELGSPAPDPKWGRARGRGYTAKMACAPDLGGAFLYGEGPHGFMKPDGHLMDDLWFYDLRAHRWICCYPGTNVKNPGLKLDDNGWWTDKSGQTVPVTVMHGWSQSAYDTHARKFVSFRVKSTYSWNKVRRKLVDRNGKKPRPYSGSPWFWSVDTGRWERFAATGGNPARYFGCVALYLPAIKRTLVRDRRNKFWYYDHAGKKWERPKMSGSGPSFGIEGGACYDSKRDRVYIGGGRFPGAKSKLDAIFIYDVKTSTWSNPKAPGLSSGCYPNRSFAYDSANDVVVVSGRILRIYQPEENRWTLKSRPKNVPGGSGFYSPELNVHIVHGAGDGRFGNIWAYRYGVGKKNAGKTTRVAR